MVKDIRNTGDMKESDFHSINEDHLQDGSIPARALKDDAVTTLKLADGAVATKKLADGAVLPAKLDATKVYNVAGLSSLEALDLDAQDIRVRARNHLELSSTTTVNLMATTTALTATTMTLNATSGVQVTGLVPKSESAAAITATRTLTARDSGGVFTLSGTIGDINLPAPAQGLNYEFLIIADNTEAVLKSIGAHIYGFTIQANVFAAVSGITSFTIATANTLIGDSVRIRGIDSSHWKVEGIAATTATFTLT